jgi:hypothetical protein
LVSLRASEETLQIKKKKRQRQQVKKTEMTPEEKRGPKRGPRKRRFAHSGSECSQPEEEGDVSLMERVEEMLKKEKGSSLELVQMELKVWKLAQKMQRVLKRRPN